MASTPPAVSLLLPGKKKIRPHQTVVFSKNKKTNRVFGATTFSSLLARVYSFGSFCLEVKGIGNLRIATSTNVTFMSTTTKTTIKATIEAKTKNDRKNNNNNNENKKTTTTIASPTIILPHMKTQTTACLHAPITCLQQQQQKQNNKDDKKNTTTKQNRN